jgi:hypothetical protein
VADPEDEDDERSVTDRVNDAVRPDADSVQIVPAFERLDPVRSGALRKGVDLRGDALPQLAGQVLQLFQGRVREAAGRPGCVRVSFHRMLFSVSNVPAPRAVVAE